MSFTRRLCSFVAVASLALVGQSPRDAAAQSSFTGIGDLDAAPFASKAFAVSPDGTKVTGETTVNYSGYSTYTAPFVWTSGAGMTGLQTDPSSFYYGLGTGITNTGVVAGYQDVFDNDTFAQSYGAPTRWDPSPTVLPKPEGYVGDGYPVANSISGTGNVIVAYRNGGVAGDRPIAWVNSVPQTLNYLRPIDVVPDYNDYGYANGVNTPGTRIAGTSMKLIDGDNLPNIQAVLWSDDTVQWDTEPKRTPIGLGYLPGISTTADGSSSGAADVSNNGQVVVGYCQTGVVNTSIPVANPQNGGRFGQLGFITLGVSGGVPAPMAALADLGANNGTTDIQYAAPTAVNGNATVSSYVVVGWGYNGLDDVGGSGTGDDSFDSTDANREALMWTTAGVQNIETVATGLGLNLTGWDLQEATGVSDDGRTIVGWGKNAQGDTEGWVLKLPAVAIPGDFNHDTFVNAGDLGKWRTDFGTGAGSDADNDGDSDGADFLTWQKNFGLSGAAPNFAAVPEPAAAALAVFGLAGVASTRARRRR